MIPVVPVVAAYAQPLYPGFTGYVGYQYPPCDPKADAHALHKAFKGLGTDEKIVIQILSNRSKPQLDEINREYKNTSNSHNTLEAGLRKEISGNFLKLAVNVITPTIILKKDTLREAVVGLGTRESALVDVLSQSTNLELAEISSDTKLKEQVLSDVSGDFKHVIDQLLQARRPQFGQISPEQAAEIAHRFYKAGEGKLGTDEREYTRIICENSLEALHQVDFIYKQKHKHDLHKAIDKETSGDYRNMLIALTTPRHQYYAMRIHNAVAGLGTNERLLNYIFGVLDKGELKFVSECYKELYKTSLKDAISGDTSGHYRDLLMALLN